MKDWEKLLVVVILTIIVAAVAAVIRFNSKYKCVRGHYELQTRPNPALKMMPTTQNVWVCDEYVLRDTSKHAKK